MISMERIVCAVDFGVDVDPKYSFLVEEAIKDGLLIRVNQVLLTEKGRRLADEVHRRGLRKFK